MYFIFLFYLVIPFDYIACNISLQFITYVDDNFNIEIDVINIDLAP